MKMYGTPLCPDCMDAEKELAEKGLQVEYVNIMESTANLKVFLQLRDQRSEFAQVRAEGWIGIPCFVKEDNSIVFAVKDL